MLQMVSGEGVPCGGGGGGGRGEEVGCYLQWYLHQKSKE